MEKVYQTVFTDHDKGIIGNCLAACIASLLGCGLSTLPVGATMKVYLDTFVKHGYKITKPTPGEPPHDGNTYIVSYRVDPEHDPRGINHTVLWCDGKIVHDPSPRHLKLNEITHYYDHLNAA